MLTHTVDGAIFSGPFSAPAVYTSHSSALLIYYKTCGRCLSKVVPSRTGLSGLADCCSFILDIFVRGVESVEGATSTSRGR
jgi:hypothetical protein